MAARTSLYGVHPGVAYTQAVLDNLQASSGRSLEAWLAHLRKSGPKGADAKGAASWLKGQGLGGTQAALVAARATEGTDRHAFFEQTAEGYLQAAEAYVNALYAGKKAHLRPLHDALLELGLALGNDVMACPCKTFVPLYRQHVIAQIKPTTLTRVDLGLALGDPAAVQDASGRLLVTGGFARKDRITHRIEIRSLRDIDGVVKHWLKEAYRRDG
jgi:hypothetical protein